LIALDGRRPAVVFDERSEHGCDVVTAEASPGDQRNALAREDVDHGEDAERRPGGGLIVDDVHCPADVRLLGRRTRRSSACADALPPLRSAVSPELESFLPIQSALARVIDRPAFASEEHVQAFVPIAHAHRRQFAEATT
jgi:hypothetical protein